MVNMIKILGVFAYLSVQTFVRGLKQCDHFEYGGVCDTHPWSNIIAAVPNLNTEKERQNECIVTSACSNFTFVRYSAGNSQCFLLHTCELILCKAEADSSMSVSGQVYPAIAEACCEEFSATACDSEFQISEILNVSSERMCQQLCRDERDYASYSVLPLHLLW